MPDPVPATRRDAICLDCRTLLARGERCDLGRRHRVVSLVDPKERRQLLRHVWGPASLRKNAKAAATAGSAGGTAGGLSTCGDLDCGSGCDLGSADAGGEVMVVIFVILAAAIVAVLLYFLVKWIVHAVRAYRNRLRPRGARALLPPSTTALHGRVRKVEGSRLLTSPLGNRGCLGYGVTYRDGDAIEGDVMVRDGEVAELEVLLDDQRVLRVPPGRARVIGPATHDRKISALEVDAIPAVTTSPDDDLPVIRFDRGEEVALEEGDAVEIVCAVEPVADPTAVTGYRDAAMRLGPVGTPVLRRVHD